MAIAAADVPRPVVVVGTDRPDPVGLEEHHVDVDAAHLVALGSGAEVVVEVDEPGVLVADQPDLACGPTPVLCSPEPVEPLWPDRLQRLGGNASARTASARRGRVGGRCGGSSAAPSRPAQLGLAGNRAVEEHEAVDALAERLQLADHLERDDAAARVAAEEVGPVVGGA